MDQHKLRSLVFEKTGVRVDTDDPIFALVALNEAVLAETVERHLALIDSASRDLAAQARAAAGLAPPPAAASSAVSATAAVPAYTRRQLANAAGIAVLSGLTLLAGQALLLSRPAAPAAVIAAPALSPEQLTALANADKLNKAIQKLDPKIQAQLQAELQK